MKDRNQLLLDFASDWTLDGDLLRCRACKRAHIASRQDEDFVHRSDCEKNRTGGRPWTVLQSILLTMPSGQSVMDLLAAATAQRDELLRAAVAWKAADEAASNAWEDYQDPFGLRTNGGIEPEPDLASVYRESNSLAAAALDALRQAIARAQSGQPAQGAIAAAEQGGA